MKTSVNTNLKQTEQAFIQHGQDRVPKLLNTVYEIDQAINANQAARQRNQVIGLISSVFGNLLLLSANLIAEIGDGKKQKA